MFTAIYRSGADVIDGVKATCRIVADKDIAAYLAEGWVKTLNEVPTVAENVIPEKEVPSREAMEIQAKALGLKFDGRTGDKKLSAMIEEASK